MVVSQIPSFNRIQFIIACHSYSWIVTLHRMVGVIYVWLYLCFVRGRVHSSAGVELDWLWCQRPNFTYMAYLAYFWREAWAGTATLHERMGTGLDKPMFPKFAKPVRCNQHGHVWVWRPLIGPAKNPFYKQPTSLPPSYTKITHLLTRTKYSYIYISGVAQSSQPTHLRMSHTSLTLNAESIWQEIKALISQADVLEDDSKGNRMFGGKALSNKLSELKVELGVEV